MTTPTPPHIRWTYADWRDTVKFPTLAQQRRRLALHLEEISGFMLETSQRNRSQKVDPAYLERMQKELDKLDGRINMSRGAARFGTSKFVRGSGP